MREPEKIPASIILIIIGVVFVVAALMFKSIAWTASMYISVAISFALMGLGVWEIIKKSRQP